MGNWQVLEGVWASGRVTRVVTVTTLAILSAAECYEPTWGQFKDRTRPALGNHEYETGGASAYFEYFGEAAGDPDKGYYS